MAKVAINGLGRIGRAALKIINNIPELDLVAVNDLVPPDNLAYLIRNDSVYGHYEYHVTSANDNINIDGKSIPVLSVQDPAKLPWKNMDVDIVLECTGMFTKKNNMQKHLDAGAKHVILSAPSKDDDVPTVVHGVNTQDGLNEKLISCASCTTNCIAPVVEVMGRRAGIERAIMTTVHAYTTSQGIVDSPAKKMRRGRAGAFNFVPTSTGAAKATTKAIPQYEGKFDGIAIRGPVPVGSIVDIVFVTEKNITVDEVNKVFQEEAESDRYKNILGVTEDEWVSSDIIKDSRASVVDTQMTQVVDGTLVKVLSWYDNEWGYASQMAKQAAAMAREIVGEPA